MTATDLAIVLLAGTSAIHSVATFKLLRWHIKAMRNGAQAFLDKMNEDK